ncbi:hypothetical protein [Actinomadura flavalba]|uniref:hypothetical protein n=1 Tax=Actinomadura flavalba TaxID=1120938 RepID=UPI00035FA386|nr:hypothetical protein [Actinomadura flavalba]
MNLFTEPTVLYLRTLLAVRLDRMRSEDERSAGASAIEWAIITAVLAAIALAIGVIIRDRIVSKAESINTG